jgi:hypothetical protein
MNETKLHYSEPLLREAVRSFFFRAVIRGFGPLFFVACGLLVVCLVYLLWSGDRGWAVGAFAAALIFIGLFFLVIYLAHYRNTIGRFRQMRSPEATLSYDDERFTLTSELGSATMPWSSITEVWRFQRFWLLLFSRSQFVTLPLDALDDSTKEFITQKTGTK